MANIDWTQVQSLGLPRVKQLSFVVADMEAALPAYASMYNIKTWYRPFFAQNLVHYGDTTHDAAWDLVYGYSGKVQVELLDLRGDEDNIFARWLGRNGPGLQHLGFYLSDLDETLDRARGMGIELLQSAELRTKGGIKARVAFLDTEAICGTTLELIETKRGPITLPPWKLMMEVGVLLGDGEKFRV